MSRPIKHIVMWTLRGETPEEMAAARLKVKTGFDGLKGRVDGLKQIEIGIDISDVDCACDVVSEFENLSDLKSYATQVVGRRDMPASIDDGTNEVGAKPMSRSPRRNHLTGEVGI